MTIYPDRAEITRAAQLELPQGEFVVVLSELPATLLEHSLRVRAAADTDIVLGAVETRKRFAEEVVRTEERRLMQEIEALRDERRTIEDQIATARVQLDFVHAIGREMPQVANGEIVEGRIDPTAWERAIGVLGTGVAQALGQIRDGELRQRTIDRTIETKSRELEQIRTGQQAQTTALVHVTAPSPSRLRLLLSYQVPNASWRPLYDARLDTATGQIQLLQLGEVRQLTGEDWLAVNLTLSTARPGEGAQLPELQSWFIDVLQPVDRDELARRGLMPEAELREAPAAAAPPVPAQPKTAEIVASEFAAAYAVAGRQTVSSDNAPHKFTIAQRTLRTNLAVRAVPKLATAAHLFGEIEHTGPEPLLPGPVNVYRDGVFVGTATLDLLRPGEMVRLPFGADDKVRVDYHLETGQRSSAGLINRRRRQEHLYRIEVANYHTRPIEITVMDQLPVPQDERIEVELLENTTPPTAEDIDGRRGILAWTRTFAPDEEEVIQFGYAVTYPEDVIVPGF